MLTELLVRAWRGRRWLRRLGQQRTEDIVRDVKPYLTARERVVDVGAGICQVAAALRGLEIDIVPVDVHDLSCVDNLTPTLYDGTYLPFDSASFDVALLVNVLHHVSDPDRMLLEAMRVADRIIIHEDIYRSPTFKPRRCWMAPHLRATWADDP